MHRQNLDHTKEQSNNALEEDCVATVIYLGHDKLCVIQKVDEYIEPIPVTAFMQAAFCACSEPH